jgi:hypothetical protein
MPSRSEHTELMNYLGTEAGRDLLPALPLISSHIESSTIVAVLRQSLAEVVGRVQEHLGRPLCLIAFGSLGRLEYVAGTSDLDPIIVVEGTCSQDDAMLLRSEILKPISQMNPWLGLDHRDAILQDNWSAIAAPEIPFPVIGTADLNEQGTLLMKQRRWQILLEGRSLFNNTLFNSIYDALLPYKTKSISLLDDEPIPQKREIDFQQLTAAGGGFFGSFDNPEFLYKSPFKYFKTRFLRDFFVFSTQLIFVLGWYRQSHAEELSHRYIRVATVNKMIRLTRFADELERICRTNSVLASQYEQEIAQALVESELSIAPLLLFGNHYSTRAARLLHGLLMSVLSRFVACWRLIYDPHVRSVLEGLPKHINFESSFSQQSLTGTSGEVVSELKQRRDSYRKYMAATATVIQLIFIRGRVWGNAFATVPGWVGSALTPFIGH